MSSLKHLHTYKKVRLKSRKGLKDYVVYVCNDKKCTHQVSKEFIIGKEARCSRCGANFIITRDRLRGATFLFCRNCIRSKEKDFDLPPIPNVRP